jgi:two-component sensor histidine kinase
MQLRSGMVQTFAPALHELATNAVKYGALSTPAGRMLVRWRIEMHKDGIEHARPRVEWQESGAARSEENGRVRAAGYGRELIERAVPYQLGAETDYKIRSEGVRCMIGVPLAAEQPGEAECLMRRTAWSAGLRQGNSLLA